ncbi:MAG: PKD domain-containing protein, partial [Candidatus Thermoplasmatota archaeon]|nr:PKD domain-containing protein [Candidatus Thermoplasmatota archaeon]
LIISKVVMGQKNMKKIQVFIVVTILIITSFFCGCTEQNNTNNNTTDNNNDINLKPISNASANPTSGTAPLTVYFSSSGSYDPDGVIIIYKWDLGLEGGRVDPTQNAINTYTQPGNYTIKLYVGDDDNAFSNASIVKITVY